MTALEHALHNASVQGIDEPIDLVSYFIPLDLEYVEAELFGLFENLGLSSALAIRAAQAAIAVIKEEQV